MSEDELLKWGVATKIIEEDNTKTQLNLPDGISGYYFGNPDADLVILNAQGGPEIELYTDEFMDIFTKHGKIDPDKVLCMNVHQIQTLKPNLFTDEGITFDRAKMYDKQNTKMLADAVKYFKSQNKKVILIGMSYGAFMVEDVLAKYGYIADKYLISVGRLDMPEEIWKEFSKGNQIEFIDGINFSEVTKTNDSTEANMRKLAAGYGYKRYTELLKDVDMSNIVYIFGSNDEAVGRLTESEIEFLENKKAKIIKGQEGHMETMLGLLGKGLELLNLNLLQV